MNLFQKTALFILVMTVGRVSAMDFFVEPDQERALALYASFNSSYDPHNTVLFNKKRSLSAYSIVRTEEPGSIDKTINAPRLLLADRTLCSTLYESLPAPIKPTLTREQVHCLPFLLSVYVVATLPSLFDCRINEENVQFNECAKEFNRRMGIVSAETGNDYYLAARAHLKQERICDPNKFAVIAAGLFLFSTSPLLISYMRDKHRNSSKSCAKLFRLVMRSLATSSLAWYIALHTQDHPFVGVICLTSLYGLGCSLYNRVNTHGFY